VPVVLVLYVMTAILYVIRWRIGNQSMRLMSEMTIFFGPPSQCEMIREAS